MALTKNTPIVLVVGDFSSIPAGASEKIYEGAMVGESDGTSGQVTEGYGENLSPGDTFVGHSQGLVDNSSGGDGGKNIRIRKGRYVLKVTLTGVVIADVGKTVYASDENTLTLTAGANSTVGKVSRYVSSNLCEVEFDTLQ